MVVSERTAEYAGFDCTSSENPASGMSSTIAPVSSKG
jgi:hypothetical protein